MSDGECVAVSDVSGHVYVLGVVEISSEDARLCLDVVADWQVDFPFEINSTDY